MASDFDILLAPAIFTLKFVEISSIAGHIGIAKATTMLYSQRDTLLLMTSGNSHLLHRYAQQGFLMQNHALVFCSLVCNAKGYDPANHSSF